MSSRYRNVGFVALFLLVAMSLLALKQTDLITGSDGPLAELGAKITAQSHTPDQCTRLLLQQADYLVQEYSTLLEGIKYVAMIGFPDYSNKGDSAIYIGELILLEMLGIEVVHVVAGLGDYDRTNMRANLERFAHDEVAILFGGGGNFGDLYWWIQDSREAVVQDFHDFPIVSFPNTFYYKSAERLEVTKEIYAAHPNLQLTARDSVSFEGLETAFGDKHVCRLYPDMATMIKTRPYLYERATRPSSVDFLILARNDGEGGQDHQDLTAYNNLTKIALSDGEHRRTTMRMVDWVNSEPAGLSEADPAQKAHLRLNAAWDYLSQGQILITDRLHAHILSTIMEKRHVVLEEGYYGKVTNYHNDWLEDCGYYGIFAPSGTIPEAVELARDLWVSEL